MKLLKSVKEIKTGWSVSSGSSLNYKTGGWKTFKPVIDLKKCIHCMRCVMYCPDICIKTKNDKRGDVDLDYCKGCGICVSVCPAKAVKMVKK